MFKTGDIAHCTGHRITSKIISKATGSNITHTAIFVVILGKVYVVEMQKNGCEFKTFHNWQVKYGYDFIVTRPQNPPSRNRILGYCGMKGYNFVLFAFRLPFKLLYTYLFKKEFKLNRTKSDKYRLTCSMMIADMLRWLDSQNYTPIAVLNRCLKEKQQIIKSK